MPSPYPDHIYFPPVNSKTDFANRYSLGEFGNASPTWDSVADWMAEVDHITDHRRFHLRSRIKGGKTHYNLEAWRLWTWAKNCAWVHDNNWYVSAMAPTDKTIFQGEVIQSENGGWRLHYSKLPKTMREALIEDGHSTQGLIASMMIRHYMCPNSYEWFNILADRYPNHVIEFSCYSIEWGTLPGFNTVFWEVRNY